MTHARATTLFTALLFAAVPLAGCLQGEETGDGELTFGTEALYPPFEDQTSDGTIFGFDVDVINEIANRTDRDIKLQHMNFAAIIPSIANGQVDGGISAFTITDERKEQVDFTVSYYDNELLVAIAGDDDTIKTEADLEAAIAAGEKLCTQTGTTSEAYARDNLGATNDTLTLLDSFPPCADALKRGDVVAMMIDRAAVRTLIDQSGGDLKAAFTVPVDEHFGIALPKDADDLLNDFNEALSAMKSDGTLKRIQDKWKV